MSQVTKPMVLDETFEAQMHNLTEVLEQQNLLLTRMIDGGGGGSSDFSTAEVTVINNSRMNIPIYAPFDTQYGTVGSQTSTPQSNISFNVIIRNNIGALLYFDYGGIAYQTEATGNIEKDNDDFIITGDGTITLS